MMDGDVFGLESRESGNGAFRDGMSLTGNGVRREFPGPLRGAREYG